MKYFDNQFLFSETYINQYIKENSKKAAAKDEDLMSLFTNIVDWNKEYTIGDYKNDPWEFYIDTVLDVLGFQHKETKGNVRVLYTNQITSGEKPVAVCYVIDKEENVGSAVKGKYYAYNAFKAAKENDVEWAILTNGYRWRIYNTKSVSPFEFYLEIDIESSIKENSKPNEAFKLFNLFFNISTYYTENGQLKIEKIMDESDKTAETIEEFLRGKSEEILKDLCYGLKENMNKQIYSEEDRKNIYNDAIILLYRLLFFGYAESRGLLPITDDDPNYTDSFENLCFDAKEIMNLGQLPSMKDGFEFWERLDSHLRVYVDNSYNGGLFHNEDKPILREYRIANEHLVKCLAEISYNKDKNEKYTSKIHYKDLSVRNLGAIYEGLLEYRLFIAEERMVQRKNKNKVSYIKASETTLKTSELKNIIEVGGIYLSQDAMERKETGAYYTPEDVVEYIVENTVGKRLNELRQQLKDRLKPYYEDLKIEPTDQGKRTIQSNMDITTLEFINENILALSIIDSAMGSGHFLVNAAYRVANEIVGILSDNDWESLDEIPVDIKEWKRKVVENCIYGIDINELSVALARLSLWLISASNDKALSFIDHHLKTGDSIIGATKEQVKNVADEKIIRMFDILPEAMLEPVIRKFNNIKEIGSSTIYDVEKQKAIYDQVEEELDLIKKKFDYYLATKYAGGAEDKNEYINIMGFATIKDFEQPKIKPLMLYAKEHKFFHWELEFPQVFANGGFDIAIGNPPYVEADSKDYVHINNTKKCHNLYAYMIETNISNMNQKAYYGFILPTACISTPRMHGLQKLLIGNSKKIYISTFDDRPAKIFQRLESMRVAIIHGELLGQNTLNEVYTTKYNRWYAEERKKLFDNLIYTKLSKYNYLEGYIPKVGSSFEDSIYSKLFSIDKKIGDYTENNITNNALHYGYGVRYWIKGMDRSAEEVDNVQRKSSGDKRIDFSGNFSNKIFTAIVNSSLFFLYFTSFSDARNLTKNTITSFPFKYEELSEEQYQLLVKTTEALMKDYIDNSKLKTCSYLATGNITYREYYPKKSKTIIDRIDDILAEYYGLDNDELEYVKNYEIQFRMGKDWEDDSDES